jgi:signal transduction histidine kinase
LKLDTHGIRFRFWLAFFLLAVGIIMFIGLLQIGLIRPYYRNSKIRSVSTLADTIETDLIKEDDADSAKDALQAVVNNDACIVMYNDADELVYETDSLGSSCIFNVPSDTQSAELSSASSMKKTITANDGEYSENLTNPTTGQEMIFYGRKITSDLQTYYLYVNSPLEPVDSIVSFFTGQYALYTVLAVAVASVVAFYISSMITRPITRMTKQARKLANADYSASFDGGSFTETNELAKTLNDADEKLSKIDLLRRDLIANVSHDIRTPLTNIRAYAEMIRDISGNNPEKREKHLNIIIRETEYMAQLTNEMSELSQMQSGNYELHKENMDLAEKIREIIELDQSLIDKAGILLIVNVPDELTVYADPVKIGQVFANYLSNAIKHTPSGKSITVSAYTLSDEETVHFEVKDDGEGIPASELPYIWDRYQKSSHTFSRNMTSTGLGLAIVKAIAVTHGAAYGVRSKEGNGSTFWFELRETHEA